MKTLIIQNCETEEVNLYDYFKGNNIDYDVFHAYENKDFPDAENYDVFFIGGTPISANDFQKHEFLRREWDYLKGVIKSNKHIFGICFGGQILAKILGAEVRRNHVMEIGGYDVKLTLEGEKDPLFEGFSKEFPVFHWHGDTFDIPPGAKLLVEGKDCKNQAFRFKKAVALQFHLEVDCKEAGKWAKAYPDEMTSLGKTEKQVVDECESMEQETKKLMNKILDNFLRL